MKLVLGLTDRLLFACGLLLAMQLPQYLDHYTQRYAGYRDALADSMAEYQRNADQYYGGRLQALIDDLRSGKPGIAEVGHKLERDRQKLAKMDVQLQILRGDSLLPKLQHLLLAADTELARGALRDYTPGLPLTADALLCGLIGALLAAGLFNGLIAVVMLPFRRRPAGALT